MNFQIISYIQEYFQRFQWRNILQLKDNQYNLKTTGSSFATIFLPLREGIGL